MADYGALAESLLQKHFPKFGTFRTLCSYTVVANAVYTPSSGNVAPVVTKVISGVFFIFADFSNTQTQAATKRADDIAILSIDQNAIIPALDLPGVSPKPGDLITDDTGAIWKVMAKGKDPKPAHYALHVRPVKDA